MKTEPEVVLAEHHQTNLSALCIPGGGQKAFCGHMSHKLPGEAELEWGFCEHHRPPLTLGSGGQAGGSLGEVR